MHFSRITVRLLRRCVLVVGAAFAMGAWSATIEVTDALGRKVKVNSPVQRVVINFNYEEFTAVAGKDGWKKVVGMSRTPWEGWRPAIFSRYASVIPNLQAMPDVGHSDEGTFSAEKIIALKPDVLFIAEWTFNALKTAREQIEAAGIPIVVIDYNAQLLERHLASTRAMGKVMGTETRAEELASLYEREYKNVLTRVAKAGGAKKKVYVELGQAGPETVGNSYSGTMWGKLITTLGADNLADGKLPGPWGPINAEAVIAENPEVIYVLLPKGVKRPRITNPQLDITWASGESYFQGIEEHIMGGVKVKITSAAKTVADCFKYREKVGIAVAAEALRDAWQKKKASSEELWQAAKVCRMTNIMRPYFDMLVT